ncbi:hypothetical protein [Rickettsia endosymbiont of Halotydeus destructor]|uniref:hypothetical protein n=1 Tax=Rickettsia endosymbiont of Halotydeus destructor TaxID=2996754 RepID=UPI003BAEBECB
MKNNNEDNNEDNNKDNNSGFLSSLVDLSSSIVSNPSSYIPKFNSPTPPRLLLSFKEILENYFKDKDKSQPLEFNLTNIVKSFSSEIEAAYAGSNITLSYKNSTGVKTLICPENILSWIEENAKWCDKRWWTEGVKSEHVLLPLHIKELNLRNIVFEDDNILRLANWLRNNDTVLELCLIGLGLNDKKVIALADMLNINKTITLLHLGRNPEITEAGKKALLETREFNEVIKTIFVDCNLGDKGTKSINIFDDNVKEFFSEYLEDTALTKKLKYLEELDKKEQDKKLGLEVSPDFKVSLTKQELQELISQNEQVKTILTSMMIGDNEIKGINGKVSVIFGAKGSGRDDIAELLSNITEEAVVPNRMEVYETKNTNFKIPRKLEGQNSTIIECPNIGDTGERNSEDIIPAMYYLWQIFNNTKLCNFVLTTDYLFRNDLFITTLIKHFAEVFKDTNINNWLQNIDKLKNSILLIVTYVDEGIGEDKIKAFLDSYVIKNESSKPDSEIYIKIAEVLKNAVNIFYKPSNDNNNQASELIEIKNLDKFVEAKELAACSTIFPANASAGSPELAKDLYAQVRNNISLINEIILNFFNSNLTNLTDAYKSFHSPILKHLHHELETKAFFEYWPILRYCFPIDIKPENNESTIVESYFPTLEEIIKLREVKTDKDEVQVLVQYLKVIKDFFGKEKISKKNNNTLELKARIDDFIHILEQQARFLKFFEKLTKKPPINPFESVVKEIKTIIEKMLVSAVKCMKLDAKQHLEYYEKAVDLIKEYQRLIGIKVKTIKKIEEYQELIDAGVIGIKEVQKYLALIEVEVKSINEIQKYLALIAVEDKIIKRIDEYVECTANGDKRVEEIKSILARVENAESAEDATKTLKDYKIKSIEKTKEYQELIEVEVENIKKIGERKKLIAAGDKNIKSIEERKKLIASGTKDVEEIDPTAVVTRITKKIEEYQKLIAALNISTKEMQENLGEAYYNIGLLNLEKAKAMTKSTKVKKLQLEIEKLEKAIKQIGTNQEEIKKETKKNIEQNQQKLEEIDNIRQKYSELQEKLAKEKGELVFEQKKLKQKEQEAKKFEKILKPEKEEEKNKYFSKAIESFMDSIQAYHHVYKLSPTSQNLSKLEKPYKALADSLFKLEDETALGCARKYYSMIGHETEVQKYFLLFENLLEKLEGNLWEQRSLETNRDNRTKLSDKIKEIVSKKIANKIAQGNYFKDKGRTEAAEKYYAKAKELEIGNLKKQDEIEGMIEELVKNATSLKNAAKDKFMVPRDKQLKTGQFWTPSKFTEQERQEIKKVIATHFPCKDNASNQLQYEIPPALSSYEELYEVQLGGGL